MPYKLKSLLTFLCLVFASLCHTLHWTLESLEIHIFKLISNFLYLISCVGKSYQIS